MSYTVVFAKKVLTHDIPALDREVCVRVQDAIELKLKTNGVLFGKPLQHSLRHHKALRVGDYRIVYRVEAKIVRIVAIVHRRTVYTVAQSRVNRDGQ